MAVTLAAGRAALRLRAYARARLAANLTRAASPPFPLPRRTQVKPRAISAQDEKLLNSLMETLERQNEEVGGDSDGDGDVEGMGNLKIE